MLRGNVYKIDELSQNDIDTMYQLMSLYYENIKRENFLYDLSNKYQVIILKDEENNLIKGFSTLVLYDITVDNIPIKLLFSGDTIIDKSFWSKNDLMQVWIQNAIELKKGFNEKFYWLLISKGYKTYKYLSSFYDEFYPRYNKVTPVFEQKIIDKFGETFYPDKYNSQSGIIVMNKEQDYLKSEYSKIPNEKLKDKNIEFFIKKNPKYYEGNELVCITELSLDNLNKKGKRIFGI